MGSGSATDNATGYGFSYQGVGSSSPGRVKNFNFSISSKPALEPTQPPVQWVPWSLSPGINLPGFEADHSPPTSSEVKKKLPHTP
jgi:hypothetical protein